MTKKELIENLSKYPEDWEVYISRDRDIIAYPIENVKILKSGDPDENSVIVLSD